MNPAAVTGAPFFADHLLGVPFLNTVAGAIDFGDQ